MGSSGIPFREVGERAALQARAAAVATDPDVDAGEREKALLPRLRLGRWRVGGGLHKGREVRRGQKAECGLELRVQVGRRQEGV